MVKIITVQTREIKRIEKFIFRSGSFDLGKFSIVYVNNSPKVVKVISVFRKNFYIPSKYVYEGVFRKMNKRDLAHLLAIEEEEKKISPIVVNKIKKYHYPMKVIFVEYSFDMQKLYIYFSSEEHLDLSILAKKFLETLKICVEFKHLSRREVARYMGGVGPCGRSLCCSSFLSNLKKVTSESAAAQDLSTDSTKFTGVCGCLMCCLEYEENIYIRSKREMPKIDEVVKTPNGIGVVTGLNVVSQTVRVSIEDSQFYFKVSELSKVE